MREEKNSEYGHFLRSDSEGFRTFLCKIASDFRMHNVKYLGYIWTITPGNIYFIHYL